MKKIKILFTILTINILITSTSAISSFTAKEIQTDEHPGINILIKDSLINKIKYPNLLPFPEIPGAVGERPLLLILIEFSNVPHYPLHERDYFDSILFGGNPSVRDYYNEVSYGKFTFVKAGILGWYTSSCNGLKEKSRDEIVREAFRSASKDRSFDFASYDVNGDHILTTDELTILICTSGYSSEHPMGAYHNWRLRGMKILTWDGMILSGEHSALQEWQPWMVYAHELGHSLLLPDLYDYTRKSRGIGVYDLMGLGNLDGTNGHQFSAWSKIKLGWIEPTIVTKDGFYVVHDSETHPEAYILEDSSHPEKEYFLVENRFRGNSYDNGISPLPDEGIAIYHIDDSVPKFFTPWTWFPWVNSNELHKMVDIECADSFTSHFKNADDLDKNKNNGDGNDLWDVTAYGFNSTSIPCNSRWYDGSSNNIGIYVLSEPGRNMTVYFSVNGTTPLEMMK